MRVLRPVPSLTRAAAAGIVVAVLLVGCASTPAGWTYAPMPSVTPIPSSAPPSGSPSAGPSGSATPSGSAAPSGGEGQVIPVTAKDILFVETEIAAVAGKPITIAFDNEDAGIPHNIQIKDDAGISLFKGDIVTGVIQTNYNVGPLAAGTYHYVCDVHPTVMLGTLTVK